MNNTERYVYHFYNDVGINIHDQLSMEHLAQTFDINIVLWEFTSELTFYKGKYKIFINDTLKRQEQWQDFGHEMAHFCWHSGSQKHLMQTYLDYQESKADYFALHFCIPTFMLRKMKGVTVYDVMDLFNVEFDFAIRRLEMYKNKLMKESESKCIVGK